MPVGVDYDSLGYSVSVSGDTAVVGAYGRDVYGSSSGAAYVFVRSGTSWSQQAELTPSEGAGDDYFGISVSVSGDTAVVGAYGRDVDGPYSGAAYVFVRSGTAWSQQAELTPADGVSYGFFGGAVSVNGDTAIVGAEGNDDNGDGSGSAYIFARSGTSWSQQAILTASESVSGDYFGKSVSVCGDTAIVGAYWDDDNGAQSGSVYIFVRSGSSWSHQAKLIASDGASGDKFGLSVSVSGNTAVVGAHHDDDNGENSGSAYVFERDGTAWSEISKLIAADGASHDNFGHSASVSGNSIVVGAYGKDTNQGSAYAFLGP